MSTTDRHKPVAGSRPLLVYDGDCGFCVYSVRYWHKLTGDRVIYRPYQEVATQYPSIPISDFQRAVQFITHDGHRASAAEASFLTLSYAPGKGFLACAVQKTARLRGRLRIGLRIRRRASRGVLPRQRAAMGQEPRTAALPYCLGSFPAPVWTDLSVGVRLFRRTGGRADRQPAVFSSLEITTGSICRPCCCACHCSMTRLSKTFCRERSSNLHDASSCRLLRIA